MITQHEEGLLEINLTYRMKNKPFSWLLFGDKMKHTGHKH